MFGSLLTHPQRLLAAALQGDKRSVATPYGEALAAVSSKLRGGRVAVVTDATLPLEQLSAVAAWCRAWPAAELVIAIEPAEREVLLGTESAESAYLDFPMLADCDGFLIIGDAFAANPAGARTLFDRRHESRRLPLVVLDAARGKACKFASHAPPVEPGTELRWLGQLTQAVQTALNESGEPDQEAGKAVKHLTESLVACSAPSGAQAQGLLDSGRALATCRRLGVLLTAEFGRSAAWRHIGSLAARLARALGGGVAPQTTGAGALAAVRLEGLLGLRSLRELMAAPDGAVIAIGCDPVGMLGGSKAPILAAAAALPNPTTDVAEVILPVALPIEMSGSYLSGSASVLSVDAAIPPPRGVPQAAQIVEALARLAGVQKPEPLPEFSLETNRAVDAACGEAEDVEETAGPVLILGRQAMHAGSGSLSRHAPWQQAAQPRAESRLSPRLAERIGVRTGMGLIVEGGESVAHCSVRVAPELPDQVVVLPEGFAEARALAAAGPGGGIRAPRCVSLRT